MLGLNHEWIKRSDDIYSAFAPYGKCRGIKPNFANGDRKSMADETSIRENVGIRAVRTGKQLPADVIPPLPANPIAEQDGGEVE